MYKNSRIRFVGAMSSAAANTTLSDRNHIAAAALPSVPAIEVMKLPDSAGGNKVAEIYIGAGSSETVTCRIYQAKQIVSGSGNSTMAVVGYVISPLASVSCTSGSVASQPFEDIQSDSNADVFPCHTYTVTVSTTATTPKGIGATVTTAYGGSVIAYSPTDGQDARIIISDLGNADLLLFDVYGGSAVRRTVFAELGV